ncbi:DUF2924 domain-containing protein [Qipengyuania sp. YG27]|uniref:DUF2924 domain-containing protein n=1 Tax=Qipengyuania mesophila TaxID=2867246 RepID=A0ABS7JS24_9SPHN|nr:DUF2924 domain-containing protein [Qipengyuania mesophila]
MEAALWRPSPAAFDVAASPLALLANSIRGAWGLDAATRKALRRSGPVEAEGRQFGVGARLSRTWKGREVVVVVEEDGFSWNDQRFSSLSAAATAIAGTRWNGPRFFGLRDS